MCALPLHAHIYGRAPSERALDHPCTPTPRLASLYSPPPAHPPAVPPARSHRHLPRLWRRQHRRSRRTRLGTAQCASNAPGIATARLSLAEKPSSDPRAILTPWRASLPIPLLHHIYIYQLISRSHSRCMRISPTHSHPNAPLITSYLLALTSLRSDDHLPRALRPCLPARSYRHLPLLGRHQCRRTHRTRLGTA